MSILKFFIKLRNLFLMYNVVIAILFIISLNYSYQISKIYLFVSIVCCIFTLSNKKKLFNNYKT